MYFNKTFETHKLVATVFYIMLPFYLLIPLVFYIKKCNSIEEINIDSLIISICLILISFTQPYENNLESTISIILLFLNEKIIKNFILLFMLLIMGFFKILKLYNFEYYANFFFVESTNINTMNFMLGISTCLFYSFYFAKLNRLSEKKIN